MSRLQKNLGEILNEKTTKIIPENIKSGVTIFGVTGTYEGSGSSGTLTTTNAEVSGTTLILNTVPYQELEYIQSSGTQYIDTGIGVDDTLCIDIVFKYTELTSNPRLFGNFIDNNYEAPCLNFYISGGGYWAYAHQDYVGNFVNEGISSDTNKHSLLFDCNNGILQIDNGSKWDTQLQGTMSLSTNKSFYIFASHRFDSANDSVSNYAKLCLYSFKVYKNSVLVRDFIPAKRKSDDVVCLYDRVSNTFFTNAGTGTFTAGPVVNNNN